MALVIIALDGLLSTADSPDSTVDAGPVRGQICLVMAVVDPAALRELRRRFRGRLLAPDDPGFDQARRVWNAMVDRHPALIARCEGRDDVAAAAAFARHSGLEVAVRSGGHSVSGHSSVDGGLMIDLTAMRDVTVDPEARVARVGGGALLRHLDQETQRFGLATTAGMVSHTGVGGLALGGGYGYLGRRFGLACDNLLAAEVVLADGTTVLASESGEPELLWGLRGGGGNFGIVTWFEFRLHTVGPTVVSGDLTFTAEDGPAVLRAFRDLVFERQDVVSSAYAGAVARSWAGFDESMVGRPVVSLNFTVTGPDLDDGAAIAASLRGVAAPLVESLEPLPYLELQAAGDQGWAPGTSRCYWKSSAFSELPDALLDGFVERGMATAASAEGCGLELVAAFGGAVAAVGEDDTAFSHREAQVDFLAVGRWTDPADDQPRIELCRENWAALAGFADAGVYVNNLGQEDRVQEAYGEAKYRRLVALKDRVDPGNLFHRNANIRPSAPGPVPA
jgi:FAD/FMN-containing dehydrogenase